MQTTFYQKVHLRHQAGATLIVALIMVLVLTLLALTAVDSSSKQTRMVINTRDRILALQAAEMGLLEGEALVESSDIKNAEPADNFSASCNGGLCFFGSDANVRPYMVAGSKCQVTPQTKPVWLDNAALDVWRSTSPERTMRSHFINKANEGAGVQTIIEFRCYRSSELNEEKPTTNAKTQRLYRVTALAQTDNGRARVMLQSTYAVKDY